MGSSLKEVIDRGQAVGNPPSLRILVKTNGKKLINGHWGTPAKFYDVGSMTKIMVTTPLCMKLFEDHKLNLNQDIEVYLPFLKKTPAGRVKVKNLLRHDSGFEAWRPFFKTLLKVSPKEREGDLKEIFKTEKIKSRSHCLYSDLDFILLGWMIEELFDMSLDEAAEQLIFKKIGLKNTFFNPKERMRNVVNFAPTQVNRLRGKIQGEVFDDNAWSMGGVAGHAGLFSTAEDVTSFGQKLLNLYFGKKTPLCRPSTLRYFVRRSVSRKKGDWGLGFTLPSRPVSTAGTKVSLKAFGHVGWTGTSLWIDPARKAVVTVLSNGTYPNKTNEAFKYLRREIHDSIWEIIDGT